MQPYQAGPTALDHEVAQGLELVLGKVAHSVPHDLDFGDGLFGTVAVLANCQREVVVLVAAHTGQGGIDDRGAAHDDWKSAANR
jgi:hypothetical protein